MYLWLRRIPRPRQFIANLGARHYFVQYPSDADTTAQIQAQIYQELENANLDEAITFFRHMLDQPHREDFYEDIYRHILLHMITEPRPITAMHPALFPQHAQTTEVPLPVPQTLQTLEMQASRVITRDDPEQLVVHERGDHSPAPTVIESSDSDITLNYEDSATSVFLGGTADV